MTRSIERPLKNVPFKANNGLNVIKYANIAICVKHEVRSSYDLKLLLMWHKSNDME